MARPCVSAYGVVQDVMIELRSERVLPNKALESGTISSAKGKRSAG